MPLRIVLFYNQAQAGWTETWYSPEDDPYAAATNISKSVWEKLVKPRSQLTTLYAARFADVVNPRRSYLLRLNNIPGSAFGLTPPEAAPDVVSTTAVLQFRTAGGKIKRVFLRGLRDGDVRRNANGANEPSGQLVSDIRAYVSTIFQLGWQMQFLQQPPDLGLTWQRVISVEPGLDGITLSDLTLLASPVPALAVGQWLRFQGVPTDELPGFPRFAKILKVVTGPPLKVTIGYRLRNQGTVVPAKMRTTGLAFSYANVATFEIANFSEHRTGRPFGSLRGRSRAKVRVQ